MLRCNEWLNRERTMRTFPTSTTLHEATASHCAFAFDTLISHLQNLPSPEPAFEDVETSLFVTWKVSGAHPRLRGCIGILQPRQLHTSLRDYALTSALRDSRFPPIQLGEVGSHASMSPCRQSSDACIKLHDLMQLQHLECTVSLLSCFETASGGWSDWQVRHCAFTLTH